MIISLLLLAGLCIWIYYCNKQVQMFIDKGDKKNIFIWVYTAMLSAVLIVAFLIFSIREQLVGLLEVFYRN